MGILKPHKGLKCEFFKSFEDVTSRPLNGDLKKWDKLKSLQKNQRSSEGFITWSFKKRLIVRDARFLFQNGFLKKFLRASEVFWLRVIRDPEGPLKVDF